MYLYDFHIFKFIQMLTTIYNIIPINKKNVIFENLDI